MNRFGPSKRHAILASSLPLLLCLLGASPSFAVDGVVEINQASVDAAGGFPVNLGSSGSYRLTSDLDVASTTNGINISAADVTLDLNGFTIRSPSQDGNGINVTSVENVEIRNGTIRGFQYGVAMFSSELVRVIDLRVFGSGDYGLLTQGNGTLVRGCTVAGNGTGIRGFAGSVLLENVVHDNTNHGMVLNDTAYGSNVLFGNNGGGAQVSASGGVQLTANQCGTSSC